MSPFNITALDTREIGLAGLFDGHFEIFIRSV